MTSERSNKAEPLEQDNNNQDNTQEEYQPLGQSENDQYTITDDDIQAAIQALSGSPMPAESELTEAEQIAGVFSDAQAFDDEPQVSSEQPQTKAEDVQASQNTAPELPATADPLLDEKSNSNVDTDKSLDKDSGLDSNSIFDSNAELAAVLDSDADLNSDAGIASDADLTADPNADDTQSAKTYEPLQADDPSGQEEPPVDAAAPQEAAQPIKQKKPKKQRKLDIWQTIIIVLGILLAGAMIFFFAKLLIHAESTSKEVETDVVTVPKADTSWQTVIVSAAKPLTAAAASSSSVSTTVVNGNEDISVDSRIYSDTAKLYDALVEAVPDEDLVISTGYISYAQFKEQYDEYIAEYLDEGYTQAEAEAKAVTKTPLPGTDEHSTGLLINISEDGETDSAAFAQTQAYTWLKDNAWQYGFIERYPQGKDSVTGHGYDPTAWRYVGKDNAKAIHEKASTLEEYTAK